MKITLNEERRALAAKPYLNQVEAAALLGISVGSLRAAIKNNAIPFRRIGARCIFSAVALQQWAQGGAQ